MGQAVIVRPQAWNEAAAGLLSLAETPPNLAALGGLVQAQGAYLFHVEDYDTGALLAAYVLRTDSGPFGPEGVIMSAAGRADFDLVANVLPYIEQQFSGVAMIRIHTARGGLIRKAARHGYQPLEFVLVKHMGALQ